MTEEALETTATEAAPSKGRIYWHSNAPWVGSGYGTQTALFGPLLHEQLGFDVAFGAFSGLRGARLPWAAASGNLYTVYPGGSDGYGNDVIGAHSKHWQADLVVTLTDPWVLHPSIIGALPCAAWIPVDQHPLIPDTHEWLVMSNAVPVAMSRWGAEVMEEAGHQPLYVPHGFDRRIFQPRPREAARKQLGLPADAFIVAMVAANQGNPSRKCFSEVIHAFSIFAEKHSDALLYLHTKLENPKGENLAYLCEEYGVRPRITDQYGMTLGTPPGLVALVYSSANVLLSPSRGEGFGVPLIESQACGTPCIVTNASAMPEVAPATVDGDPANWHVDGQEWWSNFRGKMVTPSIEEIVARLEEAYVESADERAARSAACVRHSDLYDAGYVTERYWKPVIQEAAARIAWKRSRMSRHARSGA